MKRQPGPARGRFAICMLLDLGTSCAMMAGGASLPAGQTAGFAAAAVLNFWWLARRSPAAAVHGERWRLPCAALTVVLLAFSLRAGLLELFVQRWALPQYLGLSLAIMVSAVAVQNGYDACVSAIAGPRADRRWQALVFAVVGYAFLLRLVYGTQVELLPEETYYWNYSRHLDIGYLDHPPMVAWLIRLGTTLFGDTEFGVRSGALCCGVITAVALFRLTRNVFGESSAWLALALAQLLPFFFMSGLLMTPDAPMTAAWAVALYFLERALVADRSSAWLWAGASVGLGLLAKYTIALLGVSTLVFMLLDPASRRWFRRWEPYAALVIAAAVFAPVVIWNSQHEWASFVFQTSRRLAERPRFSLHKLLGAAMVLITPTGLVALGAAFWRAVPEHGVSGGDLLRRRWRLLEICVCVPLTVFFCFSLRHEVKLDWTGAPWVAAVPVLALGIVEGYTTSTAQWRWLRRAWPPTLVLMLSIYAAGLYYLVLGIPGVGYTQHTELVPVAWREFAGQIEEVADTVRAAGDRRVLIIGMDRYAIASESAFYSRDRRRAVADTATGHLFGDMGLMYEQWFPAQLQAGDTLLLVAWDAGSIAEARLGDYVTRLGPIRRGSLMRQSRLVRAYYYRVAYGYRPGDRNGRDGID